MDTRKVVILVLVVVAVVAIMALGAGAFRDGQRGTTKPPRSYDDPDAGVELLGSMTGAFLADFDRDRLSGCPRSGGTITVDEECQLVIRPAGRRPSRFELGPAGGTVFACFALTRDELRECLLPGEPNPEELEEPAKFTVAGDTAFVHLSCRSGSACRVAVR